MVQNPSDFTHRDAEKPVVVGLTPGPWVYRSAKFDDWGVVRCADGGFICQAKDPDSHDPANLDAHRAAKTDPWEANARLIAAAPEMYAVLYEMFCEGPVEVAFAGNPAAIADLNARIRAAIDKATTASAVGTAERSEDVNQ